MAKGIAVIAGVTDFPGRPAWLPQLTRPEQSAQWMAGLAEKLNYQVRQPLLLGDKARVGEWTNAVRDAISQLNSGDALLLSFSGHGIHIPEIDRCEPDNDNEYWYFYDEMLVDNRIRELLGKVPQDIRVFVVADCCYSGGTYWRLRSRGRSVIVQLEPASGGALRKAARELRGSVAQSWREQVVGGAPAECEEPSARVLILASCSEDQEGEDGLFRDALDAALATAPWPTFEQLIERARQWIAARSSTQTPQIMELGQKTPSLLTEPAFKI